MDEQLINYLSVSEYKAQQMNIRTIVMLAAFSCTALLSKTSTAQKTIKNDTVMMMGKIVKEQFEHNKPVPGVYDYFFQSGEKKYFIKTYKCKFSKEDLDKWAGQSVEIKGFIMKNGTWDDNGEGQSRGGEFMLLEEIKKV